jgi:hypothetical protein
VRSSRWESTSPQISNMANIALDPFPRPLGIISPLHPPTPTGKQCSRCLKRKPSHQFMNKTGKSTLTCSECRQASLARYKKRNAAEISPQQNSKQSSKSVLLPAPPPPPQFLRRGQNSQDTPVEAAARRQQGAISRHRTDPDRLGQTIWGLGG